MKITQIKVLKLHHLNGVGYPEGILLLVFYYLQKRDFTQILVIHLFYQKCWEPHQRRCTGGKEADTNIRTSYILRGLQLK